MKDKIEIVTEYLQDEWCFYSKIPYSTRNERQGLGFWYRRMDDSLDELIQYSSNQAHGVRVKFLY